MGWCGVSLCIVRILSVVYQGSYRSWKSMMVPEFNVEIFKALKSLENDHRYGKVWKNP